MKDCARTRISGLPRPATAPPVSESPSSISKPLDGVHILVVDDTPDMLALLTHILRRSGATVHAAHSAIEARQALNETWVDLLLSDISMPIEDGFSLMQSVRARETQLDSHLPAIAITAFSDETARSRSLASGFDRHLQKPISPNLLVATVFDCLKQAT